MWRSLARVCLKGVVVLSPVVLAACYGAPSYVLRNVKTVAKATQQAIGGIQVSCVDSGGAKFGTVITGASGLAALTECDHVLAEDVDGDANGAYASADVNGVDPDSAVTIELSPK